jgi:hypothetical protein
MGIVKHSTIVLTLILLALIAFVALRNQPVSLVNAKDEVRVAGTTPVPIVPVPASSISVEQTNANIELPGKQIEIFDIPNEIVNKWGGLTVAEGGIARSLEKLGFEQDLALGKSLAAIIANPTAFPADYLDKTLDALYKLTVNLQRLKWIQAHGKPQVGSWNIFTDSALLSNSYLDTAISNLAKRAARVPGCELVDLQLNIPSNSIQMPKIFWYEYSLAKVESAEKYSCGAMPYTWLLKDNNWKIESERFANLRKYVGNDEYSSMHQELLGLRTLCGKPEFAESINYLGVCDWKTEPMDLGDIERLPLSKEQSFKHYSIKTEGDAAVNIELIISEIARKQVGGLLGDTIHKLQQYGQTYLRGYWVNKGKTMVVFQIDCALVFDQTPRPSYVKPSKAGIEYFEPSAMGGNEVTFLLVVTKNKSQFVVLNQSFGQYDDGSIEAVSDIDNDGNIEVWISGVWGECDGDDSVPGKNCSIPRYFKTEQFGRRLGDYVQGARPSQVTRPITINSNDYFR